MTDAGPPGLVARAQVQRRVLSLPPAPPAPRGTCTPGLLATCVLQRPRSVSHAAPLNR